MTVQWCVCDLDGTLLTNQHQISQENMAAIKRLHAKGIQFLLSTGRPDFWVKDVAAFSIAMGNAETALKQTAQFITRSNEEHGVAYAIDQWILKGIE